MASSRALRPAVGILVLVTSFTTTIACVEVPPLDTVADPDAGDTPPGPQPDAGVQPPAPDAQIIPDPVPPQAFIELDGRLIELGAYLARTGSGMGGGMMGMGNGGGRTPAPDAGGDDDAGTGDTGVDDAGDDDAGLEPDGAVDEDAGLEPDAGEPIAPDAGEPPNPMYVAGAAVVAVGLAPEGRTTTDANGAFAFTLPQNGKVILHATKLGYFPSYTELPTGAVNIADGKAFIASSAYIGGLARAYGVNLDAPFTCHAPPEGGLASTERCVFGIVVGQLLDDGSAQNGTPQAIAGVTAAEISIGVRGAVAWYVRGPYFLDYDGAASPGSTASIAVPDPMTQKVRGGYFVAFVEMPLTAGANSVDFEISAAHATPAGTRRFGPITTKVFRPYGVTFTKLVETGAPPPPDPNGGTPIDFDSQIYPLFLPLTQGGFGCQGCHAPGGGLPPAANMDLSGSPENAYRALDPMSFPARVNVASPEQSLLLRRPLFEAVGPQDHPIYAFTSADEPGYQLLLGWIRGGGRRQGSGPGISYRNEVFPLLAATSTAGGTGCVACHGVLPAPGDFFVGGSPEELYAALTMVPPLDTSTGQPYRINKLAGQADRSLILTKPLLGSPVNHAVKLFSSAADPRYQIIYRWIVEGYRNN